MGPGTRASCKMRNFPCKGSFFSPPAEGEARCAVGSDGEVVTWAVPGATGQCQVPLGFPTLKPHSSGLLPGACAVVE